MSNKKHPLVVSDDILGAVAMMDIEIDDRDPLEIVLQQGPVGADRDVIEQAEPHCLGTFGMVTGGTHCTEHLAGTSLDHEIHPQRHRPCRAQRCLQ